MTAARADPGTAAARPITVRPAPRREPPFDDELPERYLQLIGPHDRPLPFAPSQRRLTDKRDLLLLQNAEQLHLHREWDVTGFVEENGGAIGQFE